MASNLSLWLLLDSEKLIKSNFDNWYQKLKIVLEHERILYVIIDLTSEEPAPNARGAVWDTYLKWLNDRIIVCCIMWASMNDEFSQKFEEAQPEEILQVLKNFFGTSDDVERHKTSSSFSTSRWGRVHLLPIMYCTWSSRLKNWANSTSLCVNSWGKMRS